MAGLVKIVFFIFLVEAVYFIFASLVNSSIDPRRMMAMQVLVAVATVLNFLPERRIAAIGAVMFIVAFPGVFWLDRGASSVDRRVDL
jgi:uncharacterized oligopeptide transporter (OPT) family protein